MSVRSEVIVVFGHESQELCDMFGLCGMGYRYDVGVGAVLEEDTNEQRFI
jgi:hypothetical protein